MSVLRKELVAFLDGFMPRSGAVLVEVSQTQGSTPREVGAWMVVSGSSLLGTIGGGQLEFICVDNARQMLRTGQLEWTLDVPLGPEIGQCCGGRVAVTLSRIDEEKRRELTNRRNRDEANNTPVYIMGAGHVGRALAESLALLPLQVRIVDSRAEALKNLPETIQTHLTPLPESVVRAAPPRSAFVILTHDHAEDFMIAREALVRGDAAYVGMIGSKTKRATFTSWMRHENGSEAVPGALICPIGDHNLQDKRPEVIAALVAAEILVHTGRPFAGGTKNERTSIEQVEGVL